MAAPEEKIVREFRHMLLWPLRTCQVEFLDAHGRLLSVTDYGDRDKYLKLVHDIKQTPLSLHGEGLLKPMVPAYLVHSSD